MPSRFNAAPVSEMTSVGRDGIENDVDTRPGHDPDHHICCLGRLIVEVDLPITGSIVEGTGEIESEGRLGANERYADGTHNPMMERFRRTSCDLRHKSATMQPMEAAFFDLDKTIIARSSPLALSRSFLREGLIQRGTLLKSMYAQLVFQLMGADENKMEKIREESAKLTAGWEADKVRAVVTEVLEEVISPLIYAEALELMHDHRAAGRLICIVSSSPEEIVAPLADMLRADRWIATLPTIVDGKYTGELDFYAYGEFKVEAITALAEELDIDLDASFAYSDSITDLPMLESVGNPRPVNADKELRRIAEERGWSLEVFRDPVSLKDRFHLRRPEVSVNDGALYAAAILALAGLWWWRNRKVSPDA